MGLEAGDRSGKDALLANLQADVDKIVGRFTSLRVTNDDFVTFRDYKSTLKQQLKPQGLLGQLISSLTEVGIDARQAGLDLEIVSGFYTNFQSPDEAKVETDKLKDLFSQELDRFYKTTRHSSSNLPYFLHNRDIGNHPPGILLLGKLRSLQNVLAPPPSDRKSEGRSSAIWSPGHEQLIAPGRENLYPPGRRPRK